MYRESNDICFGCRRWLSAHQCHYDGEGRPVCTRCYALAEVDRALVRWHKDARTERWIRRAGALAALTALVALPALLLFLTFGMLVAAF
jgi:hypothetical protein